MSPLPLTRSLPYVETPAVFPLAQDEVPEAAVDYVRHRLFRHADRSPLDEDAARMIVAGVIAILAEPGIDRQTAEEAAAVVSELTAVTDVVVSVQAR